MKQSNYGHCGLYCGACGTDDCDGCLSDSVNEYVVGCKLRQCTKSRNIDFCCFCDDFPCKEFHEFMNYKWSHHWTIKPNLEYIQNNGKEKWLRAQMQEWSCTSCGAEIKWYQKL